MLKLDQSLFDCSDLYCKDNALAPHTQLAGGSINGAGSLEGSWAMLIKMEMLTYAL